MIDLEGLPAGVELTADDFDFHTGTGGDAASWAPAARPTHVTVRRGAGAGGSDRVTLAWSAGAVRNAWLRVMVKANAATALSTPDVFCFGNLVGETGDPSSPLRVSALDVVAARRALAAEFDSRYDFNRDGRVNALDLAAIRSNFGRLLLPPLV